MHNIQGDRLDSEEPIQSSQITVNQIDRRVSVLVSETIEDLAAYLNEETEEIAAEACAMKRRLERGEGVQALRDASDRLKNHADYMEFFIQEYGLAVIGHIGQSLRENREFMLEVVELLGEEALGYEAYRDLLAEPAFALQLVRLLGAKALDWISVELFENLRFAVDAIRLIGLRAVGEAASLKLLFADPHFVIAATRVVGIEALQYMDASLKENDEFMLYLAREFGVEVLSFASEELRKSPCFMCDVAGIPTIGEAAIPYIGRRLLEVTDRDLNRDSDEDLAFFDQLGRRLGVPPFYYAVKYGTGDVMDALRDSLKNHPVAFLYLAYYYPSSVWEIFEICASDEQKEDMFLLVQIDLCSSREVDISEITNRLDQAFPFFRNPESDNLEDFCNHMIDEINARQLQNIPHLPPTDPDFYPLRDQNAALHPFFNVLTIIFLLYRMQGLA